MKLYLVQHADAVSKDQDPARPLSRKGRGDAERMAAFLDESGVRMDRVFHSGKARAAETAAILCPDAEAEVLDGIAPNDTTDKLMQAVNQWDGDIMIVGHLPFMNRMVSRLVAGSDEAGVVAFVPGCVVCLEQSEDGWSVVSMTPPGRSSAIT
jgi:phosphohistidine phosphatase